MPRGKKPCLGCGKTNGVRAHNCIFCGCGFTIKGKIFPNINVNSQYTKEAQERASKAIKKIRKDKHLQKQELLHKVKPIINDEQEAKVLKKYYGDDAITYETNCGNFRIRYGPRFMGVAREKPFMLLKKREYPDKIMWEPAKGRNRFVSLVRAILSYVKRLHNPKFIDRERRRRR